MSEKIEIPWQDFADLIKNSFFNCTKIQPRREKLLSRQEAIRHLGITPTQLNNLEKEGLIVTVTGKKEKFYLRSSLDYFLLEVDFNSILDNLREKANSKKEVHHG